MGSQLSRSHAAQSPREEGDLLLVVEVQVNGEAGREDDCVTFESVKTKWVKVLLAAQGLIARCLDTALDLRTAVKFYLQGDRWWAFFTIVFVLVSPAVQFTYMASKYGPQIALPYIIPFSIKHIIQELRFVRFLKMLPEAAFRASLHESFGASSLNKVLAGIECGFESFPQAVIQSRAFYVKGGDWLNVASIAFSCAGVVYGVYMGVTALLKTRTAYKEYDFMVDQALDFSSGRAASFAQMDLMEPATQKALLWFLEGDELISQLDLAKATFNDDFVRTWSSSASITPK
mmetsp:Transcript_15157/g.26525  ORF Transcript_15157/g.26525 Transcript_15157/m.26525 type:complete len:289 (-) Transcript_15157:42-908(-)